MSDLHPTTPTAAGAATAGRARLGGRSRVWRSGRRVAAASVAAAALVLPALTLTAAAQKPAAALPAPAATATAAAPSTDGTGAATAAAATTAATAAIAATTTRAATAATGAALQRPAIAVRRPAGAVLLGAALAGSRVVAVGERGIAIWSDDAGRSWQQAQVPVSVTLTAVRFTGAKNGFATGHGGTVLATTDGGQTWQRRLDGHAIAGAVQAEAAAGADAKAVKAAERLVAEGADKPLLDLHFFDDRRGIVVGAYNLAFTTADAGRTWQLLSGRLPNPDARHLYVVRVRGDTVLMAGEMGTVFLSDDGGASFQRIETPYRGSWFTAELPADGSIWLAGLRGNVWRSDDNGTTWRAVGGAGPASITASALAADGSVLLATQGGQTLRAAGAQLQARNGPPLPPASALLPLPDGRLLVLGVRGAHLQAVTGQPQ